jgi:hypothetical protein
MTNWFPNAKAILQYFCQQHAQCPRAKSENTHSDGEKVRCDSGSRGLKSHRKVHPKSYVSLSLSLINHSMSQERLTADGRLKVRANSILNPKLFTASMEVLITVLKNLDTGQRKVKPFHSRLRRFIPLSRRGFSPSD